MLFIVHVCSNIIKTNFTLKGFITACIEKCVVATVVTDGGYLSLNCRVNV